MTVRTVSLGLVEPTASRGRRSQDANALSLTPRSHLSSFPPR